MIKEEKNFINKVAILTGGSSGIGLDTSIRLAELGAKVYASYRKENKKLKEIEKIDFKNNGKIYFVKLKSLKEKDIERFLLKIRKKEKKVHFLVNNIGDAIERSKFLNSKEKLWKSTFDVNFFSAVRFTKIFLKLFFIKNVSSIVNVGSIAGKTGGYGDSIHYGSAKAALHGFTAGLAREVIGLRINCVAPSIIDTPFQKRLSNKKRIKRIIKNTPIQRIGNVKDVSSAILFLCSNLSAYINGEIIYISGGRN